jgi:hypothetical protein
LQARHGERPSGNDPEFHRQGGAPPENDLQQLMKEIKERVSLEIEAVGKDVDTPIKDPTPARCGFVPPDIPSEFEAIGDATKAENYSYIAYFALMAALAEFASGNRENAIRLLGKEIERQRTQKETLYLSLFSPGDASCTPNPTKPNLTPAERLEYFRRLVVLLRLEVVQANMTLWSDNNAILPAWLVLLMTMTDDYRQAFSCVDKNKNIYRLLLFSDLNGSTTNSCNLNLTIGSDDLDLLPRFIFAMFTMENTAIWLAAENPEVIDVQPKWTEKFDKYADSLSSLDMGCLSRAGMFKNEWRARARQLDSVARYWQMRAEHADPSLKGVSRASNSDTDSSKAIDALCKSVKAYNDEDRALRQATSKRQIDDPMYREYSEYAEHKFAMDLDEGRKHIVQLLGTYPRTDVSRLCSQQN